MTESLGKVGETIAGAARTTSEAVAATSKRMRSRKDDDSDERDPMELTP